MKMKPPHRCHYNGAEVLPDVGCEVYEKDAPHLIDEGWVCVDADQKKTKKASK